MFSMHILYYLHCLFFGFSITQLSNQIIVKELTGS